MPTGSLFSSLPTPLFILQKRKYKNNKLNKNNKDRKGKEIVFSCPPASRLDFQPFWECARLLIFLQNSASWKLSFASRFRLFTTSGRAEIGAIRKKYTEGWVRGQNAEKATCSCGANARIPTCLKIGSLGPYFPKIGHTWLWSAARSRGKKCLKSLKYL